MPTGSTIREFLEAIRTGKTKTTRALDSIFTSPHRWVTDPNPDVSAVVNWIKTPNAFSSGPPPNVRDSLRTILTGGIPLSPLASPNLPLDPALALTDEEVDHVIDWPKPERLRKKAAMAMNLDCDVEFLWRLHHGQIEKTGPVSNPVAGGNIRVTFLSPERRVMLSVAGAEVKVHV